MRWPIPPGVPRWAALVHHAPPSVQSALFRLILGQPAGSPLRRRVVTTSLRIGWAEFAQREDDRAFDRVLRSYDPACEIHIGPGFPIDAESVYRGHDGLREFMRLWDEVSAVSFVCEEALDMGGPCFGLLLSVGMTGTKSGAPAPASHAVCTYSIRRGLIVRQDLRNDGWDVAPEELTAALRRAAAN